MRSADSLDPEAIPAPIGLALWETIVEPGEDGPMRESATNGGRPDTACRLALGGDVMIGRGIDQILPDPADPRIFETYVASARTYVELAERSSGPIRAPVAASEIWGAALAELDRLQPELRIVNLETSITRRGDPEPKGINYRVSPENAACLEAARIDCCALANNHVLDWGRQGLADTLETLARLGIAAAGAGADAQAAAAPAALPLRSGGRLLVFALGMPTSGIPRHWAADAARPGVNRIEAGSRRALARITRQIASLRRPDDIVVASVHWGGNWGYRIPEDERNLAHVLIDEAGVDLVHGHSSHHAKAVELHRGKLILYGCGDLLNDYEGISGHEEYRADLVLVYVPTLAMPGGTLLELLMIPLQLRRFRLEQPSPADTEWLRRCLDREAQRFSGAIELTSDGLLRLRPR